MTGVKGRNVLPLVTCENTSCNLNLYGSCQSIDTLLLADKMNGLPTPLSCSNPVYSCNIGDSYYATEYLTCPVPPLGVRGD